MEVISEPIPIGNFNNGFQPTVNMYGISEFIRVITDGLYSDITAFRVKFDQIMNVKCQFGIIRFVRVVSVEATGPDIVKRCDLDSLRHNERYTSDPLDILLNVGKQLNDIDINEFKNVDALVIDRKKSHDRFQRYDRPLSYHKIELVKKKLINKFKIIIPLLIASGATLLIAKLL